MSLEATEPQSRATAHDHWTRSRSIPVVGGLYLVTGVLLGIATLWAIPAAAVFAQPYDHAARQVLLMLLMTLVLVLAGIGLLQRRTWGWVLGLLIALSGAAVVTVRLIAGDGDGATLWGPLVTDLLISYLLLRARPAKVLAAASSTAG